MKVELLQARATANGPQNKGDIVEVSADEGGRMIAARQALALRTDAKPEKAVKRSKPEKAVK